MEMPVNLETAIALRIMAAINPTEEINPTVSTLVTPVNMLLYIFDPIVAPRKICDSWFASGGHQASMSLPAKADTPISAAATPIMLPSSQGAGNFSRFAPLLASQAAKINPAVNKTGIRPGCEAPAETAPADV